MPATEEQIAASQLVPNKIDISLIEQQIINSRSSNASWTYLSGYLVYNQTNNYHCGPAAVQAALGYLLDYEGVPSQNQVATECSTSYSGTYLENMKTYINNKQDFNNYISYCGLEQSSMEYFLYAGIVNFDAAPIIGLKPTLEDGWLYTTIGTTGHFVSVYGAKSDKSAFALVDPWIGYSGSGLSGESWSYSMSADVVYDAYDLVNCGLMY